VNNPDDPVHNQPSYTNLSPAVNVVLRRELLDLVTKGIREALFDLGRHGLETHDETHEIPPELKAIVNPTSAEAASVGGGSQRVGLVATESAASAESTFTAYGSGNRAEGGPSPAYTSTTEHQGAELKASRHLSPEPSFSGSLRSSFSSSHSAFGSEHEKEINTVHLSRVRDVSTDGADLLTSRHAAFGSAGLSLGSQLGRNVLNGLSKAPLLSQLSAFEKAKVEFTDFEPSSFARVRKAFGIGDDEYTQSFSGENTREQLSEGASNAFFFFTGDQKMLVKSMTTAESKLLRRIARQYATYMELNPGTLLPRFYGCHSIRLYGQTFHFMVMGNVFPPDNKVPINTRYDIKGSWISRNAKPKKPENGQVRLKVWDVDERVLKDNDLHSKIILEREDAEAYVKQLQDDAARLCGWGIMDYSLLVGVCDREYHYSSGVHHSSQTSPRSLVGGAGNGAGTGQSGGSNRSYSPATQKSNLVAVGSGAQQLNAACCVGPAHYYIGIIDTLQEWDWRKKGERFLKMYLKGKDGKGISCIEPEQYRSRFQLRVQDIIVHMETEEFVKERPDDISFNDHQY
jgi:hypothetical protein